MNCQLVNKNLKQMGHIGPEIIRISKPLYKPTTNQNNRIVYYIYDKNQAPAISEMFGKKNPRLKNFNNKLIICGNLMGIQFAK